MTNYLCLIFFFTLISVKNVDSQLKKKHTLKIQALLPISGNAAPLGDFCIKPIEYLVDKVNNQQKYLPDYNIVVDVADDQCSGSTGVREILPYFFSERVLNKTSSKIGIQLPRNQTTIFESAETYLVPPLLIGSLCSSVCQVVGLQLKHFELIAYTGGCNAKAVSNDKKYPNLYRSVADSEFVDVTARFIDNLKWDHVALISDASDLNLKLTEETMVALQENNVTVTGIEVFIKDPKEAIHRIKEKGARVIVVNCYFDTCPILACEAYKANLYGGRIVWLFPSGIDLVDQASKDINCSKEQLRIIRDHSLIQYVSNVGNVDETGTQYFSSEFNFLFQDLENYLSKEIANASTTPFFNFRTMCIDNIVPAIFLLDKMERKLNAEGRTLVDVISDTSMKREVMEMAREALESIDVNLFRGPVNFDGDRVNVAPPAGYYQYQNDEIKYIFKNKGNIDLVEIKWWTADGKQPNAVPIRNKKFREVPLWSTYILSVASGLLILGILPVIYLDMSTDNGNTMTKGKVRLNQSIFIGIILHLIPVVIHPIYGNKFQCSVAPVFIAFGYLLMAIGIFSRIPPNRRLEAHRIHGRIVTTTATVVSNVSKSVIAAISFGFAINALLLGLWYYESAPTSFETSEPTYDILTDVITDNHWYQCNSSEFGKIPFSAITLFAVHAAISIALLFKAINAKGRIAPATFILVISHLAAFLITAVVTQADLVFIILSIIFVLSNVGICCCFLPESVVKFQSRLSTGLGQHIVRQSSTVFQK